MNKPNLPPYGKILLGILLIGAAFLSPLIAGRIHGMDSLYPGLSNYLKHIAKYGQDRTIVLVFEDDKQFSARAIKTVFALTNTLKEAERAGIRHVRSIANLPTIKPDGEGGVEAEPLIEHPPSNEEEANRLRSRVLADPNAVGALVSKDLKAYAIVVQLAKTYDLNKISELIRKASDKFHVYMFGAPVSQMAAKRFQDSILGRTMVPAILLLLLILIWIATHPARMSGGFIAFAVFVTYMALWAATLITYPLCFTSAPAVMILGAVIAIEASGGIDAQILKKDLIRAGIGILLTGMVFIIAGLPILHPSGVAITSGALLFLAFLMISPFGFLQRTKLKEAPSRAFELIERLHKSFGITKARKLAAGSIVLLSLGAAYLLQWNGNPQSLLPDDQSMWAYEIMDEHFGGHENLHISFDTNPAGKLRTMQAQLLLYDKLLNMEEVADVRAPAEIIASLNMNFAGSYSIPQTKEELSDLMFFLDGNKDFLALSTDLSLQHSQVIIRARAGEESVLANKLEDIMVELQTLKDSGAILDEHYRYLAGIAGIPTENQFSAAVCKDVFKSAPIRHKAAVRLITTLKNSSPIEIEATKDNIQRFAKVFAVQFGNGDSKYGIEQTIHSALAALAEFSDLPQDLQRRFETLSIQNAITTGNRLCAEVFLEKAAPGLISKNKRVWQRLVGIASALLQPANLEANEQSPKGPAYSTAILGIPSIESKSNQNGKEAFVGGFILIIAALVLSGNISLTAAMLFYSFAFMLILGISSVAGFGVNPFIIQIVLALAASIPAMAVFRKNLRLFVPVDFFTAIWGTVLLVASIFIPAGAGIILISALGMLISGPVMLLITPEDERNP